MRLPVLDHVWTVDDAENAISQGTPALIAVQGGVPIVDALQRISKVLLHSLNTTRICESVWLVPHAV